MFKCYNCIFSVNVCNVHELVFVHPEININEHVFFVFCCCCCWNDNGIEYLMYTEQWLGKMNEIIYFDIIIFYIYEIRLQYELFFWDIKPAPVFIKYTNSMIGNDTIKLTKLDLKSDKNIVCLKFWKIIFFIWK